MEDDTVQEYDPTVTQPLRIWVFCRACRCRLQVRLVPRPDLPFTCLCGIKGSLADFDAFEAEERAKEVSAAFEVGYQAAKQALADVMPMQKTRMYSADAIRQLLEEEEAPEERFAPKPFETEAEYRETLGRLMRAIDAAGADLLRRHRALTDVIEFTFPRRHLRSAARSFCIRACQADHQMLEALVNDLRARSGDIRLRFPFFKCLMEIYEEAGDLDNAIKVGLRAHTVGLGGFADKVKALKARRR